MGDFLWYNPAQALYQYMATIKKLYDTQRVKQNLLISMLSYDMSYGEQFPDRSEIL